ncbi:MAG: hypothetical protein JW951_03685 [Lentisphaerae bacterium]|nr:hypothetical protein [Lentisphaerota bacterium]
MRNPGSRATGAVLAALSLYGAVYGVRAGRAQCLYCAARFAAGPEAAFDRTAAACERAYRLYPHQYAFSILAAERAYFDVPEAERTPTRLEAARRWCERGLAQNPHKRRLHLLKAYLLARENPAAGAAWWATYTDRRFWDPFNHSVMAELWAAAGEYRKARESLRWTEGTPYYKETRALIREAWRREAAGPPPRPGDQANSMR